MKQVLAKKYTILEDLPEAFTRSFGSISTPVYAIIWGESGQGKSNLVMSLMEVLAAYGKVLYLSLEEGHELTIQNTIARHFEGKTHLVSKIRISDHQVSYDDLVNILQRRNSPKAVIIDSLQYIDITYKQYKDLKKLFPTKSFLFVSHCQNKKPKGSTASAIKYDAGLKIFVEGYIAFPVSRYGGNQPFVIWEDGAKRHWGKDFKKHSQPTPAKKAATL